MGQGAYLSTALAIRIVVREVGQAVVGVVVAAEVVVVGTRVVVLGRVAGGEVTIPRVQFRCMVRQIFTIKSLWSKSILARSKMLNTNTGQTTHAREAVDLCKLPPPVFYRFSRNSTTSWRASLARAL